MSDPVDVRDRPLHEPEQFPVTAVERSDLAGIVLPHGEIQDRVETLAAEVSARYRQREGELHAVCVLKGAMRFFTDLLDATELTGPVSEGAIRASRYAKGQSGGEAAIEFLDPDAVTGNHVLVVEDIVDEGHTLDGILREIQAFDPASVEVAVLLDKTARREIDVDVAFTGFLIPDEFVVGYGLDYDERYRDLRHVSVLDPEIYTD